MTWTMKCWACDEVAFHLEVYAFTGQTTHQSACHVSHHHLHLGCLQDSFHIFQCTTTQLGLPVFKCYSFTTSVHQASGIAQVQHFDLGSCFWEWLIVQWGSNLGLHIRVQFFWKLNKFNSGAIYILRWYCVSWMCLCVMAFVQVWFGWRYDVCIVYKIYTWMLVLVLIAFCKK